MKNFAIVGPTSSGKTSLSIELCKKFEGEIISGDSRQVYKYMDIGTGKVPLGNSVDLERHEDFWMLNGAKVWGYDLAVPGEYFSAYDFALYALEKSEQLLKRKKTCFLTGGTGFYIDLVAGRIPLNNNKKPDFSLRSELEKMTTEELFGHLTSLNLEVAKNIDKSNRVRLIRAIEKEKGEKNSIPSLPRPAAPFIYIGLTGPRSFLYSRADKWVDEIWGGGLLPETTKLLEMNFGSTPPLRGLVYKTAVSFLNKEISEKDAVQRIKFDLHAYIRRQQTWFKKNPEINWFDISVDSFKENIYNFTKEKMKNG